MINNITGHTRLAGLFALPSSHSVSPMIHNTGFHLLGIDAVYLAFEVGKESLPQAIQSIRDFNMLGANLSMPNKTLALDYMDDLSQSAKLIGSINTISNDNGKLTGYNTDGSGFMTSLEGESKNLIGEKITVLGTGGGAMAIIAQAGLDGVKEIAVFNRISDSNNRSQEKLDYISRNTGCKISFKDLADQEALAMDLKESRLLVNATSVGMKPLENQSPVQNFDIIGKDLLVYDIIYTPRESLLLKEARKRGAKTLNGLGMILYQGAEAFEKWTGKKMPIEEIKKIIDNI